MNKNEIVNQIAKRTGVDARIVMVTLEEFLLTVRGSIYGGEAVYLRGFGTFSLKIQAEKKARDFSKKTTMIVPRRFVTAFKPSSAFFPSVAKE